MEKWFHVIVVTQDRVSVLRNPRFAEIVRAAWNAIPAHFPEAQVFDLAVGPDHVHGLIYVGAASEGAASEGAGHARRLRRYGIRPPRLSVIIGAFKSACSKEINRVRGTPGAAIWQRGFRDHFIRNETHRRKVVAYIRAHSS